MNWADYPNFSKAEFDCKHTGLNGMLPEFMERLQELRTEYGKVRRVEILSSLMTVYTMLELQTTDRGVL